MSRLNTGTKARIHEQGSVKIQCTYDVSDFIERWRVKDSSHKDYVIYHEPVIDGTSNDIYLNDLVFQVGSSRIPRSTPLKNAPAVCSTLNGLCVRKADKKDTRTDHEILTDGIRFIGVSLHDTFHKENGNEKKQITVSVAGTRTIQNNSNCDIFIGDTILWAIPTKQDLDTLRKEEPYHYESGTKKNDKKVRLMTVPYDPKIHDIDRQFEVKNVFDDKKPGSAIEKSFRDLFSLFAKMTGTDESDIPDLLKSLTTHPDKDKLNSACTKIMHTVTGHIRDLERRKIGKALSYAKAGEDFDIFLC